MDIKNAENKLTAFDFVGLDDVSVLLDDDKLLEIGARVVRDYDSDAAAFKERRTRIENMYKLALQAIEKKDYPFEGASNIKYPSITTAALAYGGFAYPSIVKGSDVVKGAVIGNDDGGEVLTTPDGTPIVNPETGKEERVNAGLKRKRADRVASHMSYQILRQMDGWQDDMDKLLIIHSIVGCAFKKTYYDAQDRMPVSKLVLPQFLIADPYAKTEKKATRLTEEMDLYPNEIESNIRQGLFRSFEYSAKSSKTTDSVYTESIDVSSAIGSDDVPHLFIEQHCWLDLDDDGYAEPYIVWVHVQSSQVARIQPRYDADSIVADNVVIDESGEVVSADILRINPDVFYTKFDFFPDPEGGFYGVGYGHLMQHINETVNTSINQLIDAGHRYVMGGGFIGSGLKMKKGMTRFRPGEFKTVESAGLIIRDNIVPLPMPEPSQVLFMLTDYLVKSLDSITATSKVLTGDLPANMAATTALAGIEQGLVPFKAVFRRVHRALEKEFKRIFELNKKYLSPDEYLQVLDDPNADFVKDYVESNTDIVPVSDLEMMTNMQSLIKAQALMDFKDDPLIDQIEIRKRVLEAIGVPDIDKLIKAPSNAPDPVAQAQVAAFEAQIIDLKAKAESTIRDSARKDMQAADDHIKTQAEMLKIHADALYTIARAESTEKGSQLAEYSTMLNLLKEQLNASNKRQPDQRAQPDDTQQRVPVVDQAPSDDSIREIPQ